MKEHVNRKKFVVYEPLYFAGMKYKTVYSWYQAKKLCKKWGVGSEIFVNRLSGGTRSGGLNFWNTEDTFEYR